MSTVPPDNESQSSHASEAWPPSPVDSGAANFDFQNTSGSDGPVPVEIERLRWNWGAFLLGPFWLCAHGMWMGGILLLLANIVTNILVRTVSPAFNVVLIFLIIPYIVIAVNGDAMAWRNRRFDDIEHFFRVEKAWKSWGIAFTCIALGLIVIGTIMIIAGSLMVAPPSGPSYP